MGIIMIVGIFGSLIYALFHTDDWDRKYEDEKRVKYENCLMVTNNNMDYCYNTIIRIN